MMGAPPAGVMTFTGEGSAKKTAQVVRGKPPAKPISIDTGAVDDIIRSTDGRITIEHVKDKTPGKEIYNKGGVRLVEVADTSKGKRRGVRRGRMGTPKELRGIDLGAGVESVKGLSHIKL